MTKEIDRLRQAVSRLFFMILSHQFYLIGTAQLRVFRWLFNHGVPYHVIEPLEDAGILLTRMAMLIYPEEEESDE